MITTLTIKTGRNIVPQAVIAAIGITILAAGCFSPWAGNGNITISLDPGPRQADGRYIVDWEWEAAEFEHEITLRGPGGVITKTLGKGVTTAVIEAVPGKWSIDVRAYGERIEDFMYYPYPQWNSVPFPERMLRALGINSDVEVTAGNNTNVPLRMTTATLAADFAQLLYIIDRADPYGGEEIIVLDNNMEFTSNLQIGRMEDEGPLYISATQRITLMADRDIRITRGVDCRGNLIQIVNYSILKLGKPGMAGTITFDGCKYEERFGSSLILVDGGSLEMNSGVTLANNYNLETNMRGGAVTIQNSSSFYMNGGEITNNVSEAYNGGGGICVSDGLLEISGDAVISHNIAPNGGGINVNFGTFILRGGTIKSNHAQNEGGGVYLSYDANFIKEKGGVIYGFDEGENTNTVGGSWNAIAFNERGEAKGRNKTVRPDEEYDGEESLENPFWELP